MGSDPLSVPQIVEFKRPKITDAQGIDGILRVGARQADTVVLDIIPGSDMTGIKDGITDRVQREPALRSIWILVGDSLVKRSRESILRGDWGGL